MAGDTDAVNARGQGLRRRKRRRFQVVGPLGDWRHSLDWDYGWDCDYDYEHDYDYDYDYD